MVDRLDKSQLEQIEGVAIVDIDERSLAKLGPYNKWPRSHHGKVVNNLTAGGASAVIFDILFKTADFGKRQTTEVVDILKKADKNTPWDRLVPAIRAGLNYDSILVSYVANSPMVIGAALLNDTTAYQHKSDWEALSTEDWHNKINPSSTAKLSPDIMSKLRTFSLLDNIFPEFGRAASRIGLVNVVPDADGVHRRIPIMHNFPDPKVSKTKGEFVYPIIALQGCLHLLGKTLKDIEIKLGEYVNLGAPFRIFNKNGLITTSYPHFTLPMVREIIRKKKEIRALGPDNTSSVHITNPIIVRKNADEEVEIEIFGGQIMPLDWVIALRGSGLTLEKAAQIPQEEQVSISQNLTLGPGEEKGMFLLRNPQEDEEAEMDTFTLDVILNQWPLKQIESLKPEGVYFASILLDIGYNKRAGRINAPIPILTKEVLTSITSASINQVNNIKEGEEISFGREIKIPVDEYGCMLIYYQGKGKPNRTYRYLSYYDVISDRYDPTQYQGKAFILGSSATALFDIVASTFEEDYPGVEIHATLLNTILTNTFMRPMKKYHTFLIVLCISLFIGFITYFLPPVWSVIISVFTGGLYLYVTLQYFNVGLWVEVMRPELAIIFTFLMVILARYIFEERDKKFLNDAFKNYISPELIDQMIESGSKPSLGGSEGIITAYFTDIQGFSTFSEKLGSPTKLVELLNEYLSAMTEILIGNQGTLDKYEGDAIIAFFGAPVVMKDHAGVACLTALYMQEKLKELRKKWASEGEKWPEIVHNMRMRIGINSGPIVTGNMGSRMRMNYTMMGDAVNLAARLESGAKQYGVYSIASEDSLKLTAGQVISRELDLIRVVGKSEPVRIFELLCTKDTITPDIQKCLDIFAAGLDFYRRQKWDDAIREFTECGKFEPHNPATNPGCKTMPSLVMLERCEQYKTDRRIHLPEDWDGVYTATEK